jgi:hypothetical protein
VLFRSLRNRWATGLSRYRRGTSTGPSDTVWMGFFRTHDLRALGGWHEDHTLNEDYDLNRRYREEGWLVWFDHTLRSGYLPRRTLGLLGRQHFRFGQSKGRWWAKGDRPVPRQMALLAAPLVGAGLVGLAWRRVGPAAALLAPAALLGMDAAGRGGRVDTRARLASTAAIAVISGSWWLGVVAGAGRELMDRTHANG